MPEEKSPRKKHLDWCKQRALAELDRGSVTNALASMASDLGKSDETRNHPAMMLLFVSVTNTNVDNARMVIEGFN